MGLTLCAEESSPARGAVAGPVLGAAARPVVAAACVEAGGAPEPGWASWDVGEMQRVRGRRRGRRRGSTRQSQDARMDLADISWLSVASHIVPRIPALTSWLSYPRFPLSPDSLPTLQVFDADSAGL